MFRAIKRLFIWMGLMAEKATETDAINQAVVERGIRDSKAKADKEKKAAIDKEVKKALDDAAKAKVQESVAAPADAPQKKPS